MPKPVYVPTYRASYGKREMARYAVKAEVNAGRLPRPKACAKCAENDPSKRYHYHHFKGYDEEHWLSVVPLCSNCHREAHHADRWHSACARQKNFYFFDKKYKRVKKW